jgi:hypothetical protein
MPARPPCLAVLCGAAVIAACRSSPLRPSVDAPDAGIDAGTDASDAAHDVAPDGALDEGGDEVLHVVASAPPSDDHRLTSFAVGNPGASPNGWDNCWGPTPLSRAPRDCAACPAPSSGTSYLRYKGPSPPCDPTAFNCEAPRTDSQIYGYFTPALAAGSPQAVWFELIHIGGNPSDATLALYATDDACVTLEPLGTWGMTDILSRASEWISTCVTIAPHQPTSGIGFTFSGANVDLGMEGPWFGPPCPAP